MKNEWPELEEVLKSMMAQCLSLAPNGRYYPTEMGCRKLEEIMAEHGIPVAVTIDENLRYAVRLVAVE